MQLVEKPGADSLRSKHRLGEDGLRNGFLFLDGNFLWVRYDHFGSLTRQKGDPFFLRENHADDKQVRNLVVREQPPSRQYGTESLSHPLIIPLRPAKHAFEIRYHASAIVLLESLP